MTSSRIHPVHDTLELEHLHAREQMPWYVMATLDADETRRVRNHLAACALCSADFERETRLAGILGETRVVDLAPQAGLATVMARIDAHEARRAFVARLLRPWTGARSHRLLLFTAAIQAAVIILLAGLMVADHSRQPALTEYRTLSNATAQAPVRGPQLRVVFDDRLTISQVRALLDHIDGRIVGGPQASQIFTVELRIAPDAAVRWLRSQPGVRLAEIVSD